MAVSRVAPSIARALTDGQHLVRWPRLAAISPPVALAVGATVESVQRSEVFTGASWVVAVLLAIGVSSVQLGWWALLGYVAADLASGRDIASFITALNGHRWVPDSLESPLSAGIEYGLLATALIGLPAMVAGARLWLLRSGLASAAGPLGQRRGGGLPAG